MCHVALTSRGQQRLRNLVEVEFSPRQWPQSGVNPMQKHSDAQVPEIGSATKKQAVRARGESDFESLLDVAEAARLLRIHPKTLRSKARRGVIPGVQVGRLWRFRASVLNEWLDDIAS
jgi:excisionase family DNA binding protein